MTEQRGHGVRAALLGWWSVVAPSLAFAGVQASWAVQIGHGSAHLHKLGLSNDLVGIAWLAGPITGAIVQPIVGAWSDRRDDSAKLGKRKPFMLGGAIGMLVGLVLFSNSGNIASWLGDPISPSGSGSKTALGIAIASFWVVDTFTNVLQAPSRAHLGDIVPIQDQVFGNAYFAVANGMGKVIGYAFGSFSSKIEIIYGLTGLVALILTLITVFGTATKPPSHPVQNSSQSSLGSVEEGEQGAAASSWLSWPSPLMKAFRVQFFAYFAWMLVFVYGANWVGKEVFSGSAEAALSSQEHRLFVEGVSVANQGYLAMAILSIGVALVLPWSLRAIGLRVTWSLSMLVFAACLLSTLFASSATAVRLIFGFLSVPLAASFTIPWLVVAAAVEGTNEESRGRLMATFNLSQSVPGIAAALLGGVIVRLSKGNLSVVLAVGGAVAIVSAALAAFAEIPPNLIL